MMTIESDAQIVEYDIVLANLLNARDIWGEHSPQYRDCRQIAETMLQKLSQADADNTSTTTAEDLASRIRGLVLTSSQSTPSLHDEGGKEL